MSIDLLGSLPLEVSGYGLSSLRPNTKFYDMCYLKLKFPSDIFVFINIGWLSPIKKRNMTIVGNKNRIVFDDTVRKKIAITKNLDIKSETHYPSFSNNSPLSMEILSFVDLIKNKSKRNNLGVKMGLNVVRVIEACEKSMQAGGKSIKIN